MFRFPIGVTICLAGLVVLSSCDVNNKAVVDSADRISVGDSLSGALTGTGTSIVATSYGFHADSGKTYSVAWNEHGGTVAMGVEYADGGIVYFEASDSALGFAKAVVFPALRTGEFKLVATGVGGARYDLKLGAKDGLPSWVVEPDAFEYDDHRAAAANLPADSSWQHHSLTTSGHPDVDWMRVAVDSGFAYTVVRRDSMIDGVVGGLFNADSVYLGESVYGARKKGFVYYRVAAASGRGGSYRVQAVASRGLGASPILPDKYEDDNSLFSAKSIGVDSVWQTRTIHAFADGSFDRDLIWFHGDSGKTFRVYFKSSDATYYYGPSVRVLGGDSVEMVSSRGGQGDTTVVSVPCFKTGRYYLEVTDPLRAMSYSVAVGDSNGIAATMRPGPTWGRSTKALALTLPDDTATFTGKLFGVDTNWLKLSVHKGFIYDLNVAEDRSSSGFRGVVQIQDSAGTVVDTGEFNRTGSMKKVLRPTFDGVYYLRIAPWYAHPAEVLTYQVQVKTSRPFQDSLEPDNSLSQAAPISVSMVPLKRWVSNGDVDWMKFSVDSGHRVEVVVDGNVTAALYSPDSLPTGSYVPGTNTIEYLPRHSGVMFLRVSTNDAYQEYSVRIKTLPLDSFGRCGSLANACPVASDSLSVERKLANREEVWFKLPVKAGTTYRIDEIKSGYYLGQLQFFASDSSSLKGAINNDLYSSIRSRSYYRATVDETIYMRLLAQTSNGALGGIWLWVSEVRDDPSEPANNTFAGALELPNSGAAIGGVLTEGDRDFLKFQADSGRVYLVKISAGDSVRTRLLQSDSVEDAEVKGGGATQIRYVSQRSGTRYLELTGRAGWPETKWSATVSAYDADGFAPTPNMASAAVLASDGVEQHRRLIGHDQDWIAVSVDSGAVYTFVLKAAAGFQATYFTEDSLRMDAQSWVTPVTVQDQTESFSLPRKGRIFVNVNSGNADMVDYTIKAAKKAP